MPKKPKKPKKVYNTIIFKIRARYFIVSYLIISTVLALIFGYVGFVFVLRNRIETIEYEEKNHQNDVGIVYLSDYNI